MADIFKIPLSDSNVYSQILPTLVSIINKKSIKRKFSGSGCVMIPGFNVAQYFKLNGTEYTFNDLVAEAIEYKNLLELLQLQQETQSNGRELQLVST